MSKKPTLTINQQSAEPEPALIPIAHCYDTGSLTGSSESPIKAITMLEKRPE